MKNIYNRTNHFNPHFNSDELKFHNTMHYEVDSALSRAESTTAGLIIKTSKTEGGCLETTSQCITL
jgi:hypothetical protein